MTIGFDGKVALVTGAGGGLGRAHALELARRGAKVVVNDLGGAVDGDGQSSAAAEAVADEIEAAGGEAMASGADITDVAAVADLAAKTIDRFGRIDILINNAGILRDRTFHKMSIADFEAVLDVHTMGTVKVTKAVWPHMREQNYGRIVVTTSSSGLYGNFGQSNYGAAKMAVIGLINTLKLEGEKHNIRCNAVAPVAHTRMTADLFPPEAVALAKPEHVTPAVIYLAADDAPTGVILAAGAGAFAKVEIVEAPGVHLGGSPSAEGIARKWHEISDMTHARAHFMGGEQTGKFFDMATK